MSFETGYGFQNVPKVIAFDLNTFFFQTISFDLISKTFSYYKSNLTARGDIIIFLFYNIDHILYNHANENSINKLRSRFVA